MEGGCPHARGWKPLSAAANAFMVPKGESRRGAVDALFKPPSEAKFFLDCSTAIAAVQYRALAVAMDSITPGWFDAHFSREKAVIKLEASDETPKGKQRRKPPPDEIYEEVALSSGFGVKVKTHDEMVKALIDSWEQGLTNPTPKRKRKDEADPHEHPMTADDTLSEARPGLDTTVRRLKNRALDD